MAVSDEIAAEGTKSICTLGNTYTLSMAEVVYLYFTT